MFVPSCMGCCSGAACVSRLLSLVPSLQSCVECIMPLSQTISSLESSDTLANSNFHGKQSVAPLHVAQGGQDVTNAHVHGCMCLHVLSGASTCLASPPGSSVYLPGFCDNLSIEPHKVPYGQRSTCCEQERFIILST